MDGWVMSNGSQDSQKVCTKLLSLPDNAKKPTSMQVKNLVYGFKFLLENFISIVTAFDSTHIPML